MRTGEALDNLARRNLVGDSVASKEMTEVRGMRAIRVWVAVCGLLAVCITTQAQQKSESKTYVLKAARMFDGKGNSVTSPGVVVVSD